MCLFEKKKLSVCLTAHESADARSNDLVFKQYTLTFLYQNFIILGQLVQILYAFEAKITILAIKIRTVGVEVHF